MKVAQSVAQIKLGQERELSLGSLAGKRDWGWAPDYVKGMWMMLQSEPVDDFILATGVIHTVEELVAAAFRSADLNWRDYVRYDPDLVTAVEPYAPCGNPSKARRLLGWKNTVPMEEMMDRLVAYCLKQLK
jgi:GDPmannose 4,6-dehydratase